MIINGRKVVVIGGAGFIGSHLVEQLLKENIGEIIIYDNFARGSHENINTYLKDKRVTVFDAGGDILQYDILCEAIKGASAVFHLAALWLLQCHEFPNSAFETNIRGTFNVIDACVKNNVEKLIYSSSASVYGDALTEPIQEDHPFNNKNFYGATKICGEAMLKAYHYRYGLNFIGLRYMNVYGPRQDYKGAYIAVIMKMLDSIDNNINPSIYGDGSEAFDFVSVEDCARANVCAVKSDIINDFYNVGTGKKTTLKELAELILEITSSNLSIDFKTNKNSTIVKNRVGSPDKAFKELNFKSSIPLKEGLKMLIDWRNKHKSGKL